MNEFFHCNAYVHSFVCCAFTLADWIFYEKWDEQFRLFDLLYLNWMESSKNLVRKRKKIHFRPKYHLFDQDRSKRKSNFRTFRLKIPIFDSFRSKNKNPLCQSNFEAILMIQVFLMVKRHWETQKKVVSETSTFQLYFVHFFAFFLHLIEIRSKPRKKVLVTDIILFRVQQLYWPIQKSLIWIKIVSKFD